MESTQLIAGLLRDLQDPMMRMERSIAELTQKNEALTKHVEAQEEAFDAFKRKHVFMQKQHQFEHLQLIRKDAILKKALRHLLILYEMDLLLLRDPNSQFDGAPEPMSDDEPKSTGEKDEENCYQMYEDYGDLFRHEYSRMPEQMRKRLPTRRDISDKIRAEFPSINIIDQLKKEFSEIESILVDLPDPEQDLYYDRFSVYEDTSRRQHMRTVVNLIHEVSLS